MASYRKALEKGPECVEALTNLALVSYRQGDHDHCSKAAERALALGPDREPRRALESMLAEVSRQDEAPSQGPE